MAKTLVLYYSKAGENYASGKIVNLPVGNTAVVVQYVKEAMDVDVFEIQTVKAYAKDYATCTKEVMAEYKQNQRPTLVRYLDDIRGYDTVIVAGPCWCGTYPMAIFSQLERLDWQGKTIYPIMTHEGSGLGQVEQWLKRICPKATIKQGLALHGSDVHHAKNKVLQYVKTIEEETR